MARDSRLWAWNWQIAMSFLLKLSLYILFQKRDIIIDTARIVRWLGQVYHITTIMIDRKIDRYDKSIDVWTLRFVGSSMCNDLVELDSLRTFNTFQDTACKSLYPCVVHLAPIDCDVSVARSRRVSVSSNVTDTIF